MPNTLPSQKVLKEIFFYNNGSLIWKHGRFRGYHAGRYNPSGYVAISLINDPWTGERLRHYGRFLAHRLIYKYCKGNFDVNLNIDHINGVRDDNRIENLQLLTHSDNSKKKLFYMYPTPIGGYKGDYMGYSKFPVGRESELPILSGKEHNIPKHLIKEE